jgi:hypothetical protein
VRYYVRDIIAPRFYASAKAEYLRHFPHHRWEQCQKSLALMRRFTQLSRLPFGRVRLKRAVAFRILAHPKLFAVLFPLLRRIVHLPRL